MSKLTDTKDALKAAEAALEEAIARQSKLIGQHNQNISEIVHDIKIH